MRSSPSLSRSIALAVIFMGTLIVTPIAGAAPSTPEASPPATPETSYFPAGPLGEQAAWTLSVLTSSKPVSEQEVEQHLSPEVLSQVPAAQIVASITQLQQAYGPFTIEPDSVVVSANEPPTQLSYIITGQDGTRLQVGISLDPASGLLTGFLLSPAAGTPVASPVAAPLPAGVTDTDISFTSGPDTLYGSFMTPSSFSPSETHPAALIISGSGPTDRNGDSPGLSLGTNRNLAVTLAEAGVASLRYDKVGSGQTALASHADGSGLDYELFVQEVQDAVAFLASQPGVDPDRIILVGHSEGALFALVQAKAMVDAGTGPAALILVAPLSVRYLDTMRNQLDAQIATAVAAGQMPQDAGDKTKRELDAIIESLRTTGKLPATIDDPSLTALFTPLNAAFLAQIDALDPADVAASLPSDLPVLVLLGDKDTQITTQEVRHLMDGFARIFNSSASLVILPNANHVLRIVEGTPNPSIDYRNPDLPFSPEAIIAIDEFLASYGLTPAK